MAFQIGNKNDFPHIIIKMPTDFKSQAGISLGYKNLIWFELRWFY
jgi:hypothetical protein